MKKYLSIILAFLTAVNVLAGCAGQANMPEPEHMSDDSFSKEDYQKLSALQFDDYRHMTVAEFQNKVWKMTDTPEYLELLERFSKSETLYQLKDSDETAAFLFYVLDPLRAETWQSRTYSGAVTSDFSAPAENAVLEYTYTLTILNADGIMVKDYFDTGIGIRKGIFQDILRNRTKEELRNKAFMQKELEIYLDEALSYMQTPELSVTIEYAYFPLSAENDNHTNEYLSLNAEQRRYPNGAEEDYRTLLSLKTSDYTDMWLADFNSALLDWANENHERMERVSEDTAWNDFQVTLTDEELSFVKLTVFLSGMENGKAIQSSYIGQPLSPYYEEELPQKITNENGVAWCSLCYQFSYNISDTETVTVGERDRQIEGMINAVHAFWNNADIENILKMSESDIVQELKKIAEIYSTEHITITTDEEQVHFERMDEREYSR